MVAKLRTRRSLSGGYECSSLPTFCDYGEAGASPYPLPPTAADVSSYSHYFESAQEYRPDYLMNNKPKSSCLSWKSFLIRSFFVVAVFGIVSHNLQAIVGRQDILFDDGQVDSQDSSMIRQQKPLPSSATITTTKSDSEERIQSMSKALLFEKYGRGPHLVEFVINIWSDDKPVRHFFTVELAPTDLMPATTYFFLEQISRGLWSGTSIHLNADHVIAARPVSGNGQISRRKDFMESGFGSLPIVEHSNMYPHKPYTLGFRNQQDAPAVLYINKRHNLHAETEACFAEVVIGRSTIDKLASMRGHELDPARIRPVDIVMVRKVSITELNERAAKEYLTVKAQR